jgi:hypothetical protein
VLVDRLRENGCERPLHLLVLGLEPSASIWNVAILVLSSLIDTF